jgi:hypothetical protein
VTRHDAPDIREPDPGSLEFGRAVEALEDSKDLSSEIFTVTRSIFDGR